MTVEGRGGGGGGQGGGWERERCRGDGGWSEANMCYTELYNWGDAGCAERAAAAGRRHVILYCPRSREAYMQDGPSCFRWRFYPKHHMFLHCVENLDSPMLSWCYSDESSIGEAAEVAGACHPRQVSRAVMQRYRLRLGRP